MFTQCPECGTVFRVSAAVLRAAHGQVRCGVCAATFDALAYLTDADGEPARPFPEPEPGPPASDPDGLAELRARVASLQAEIPLEGEEEVEEEAADEEELEIVEDDAADEEQPFDFEFDLGAAVPDPRPAADEARAKTGAAGTPPRTSAPRVAPPPPRTPPRAPPVPPPPAPDLEAEVSESALEFNLPAEEWEQVFVTGEYPIAPESFAAPAPADEPRPVRARLGARVAEPPDDPLAQTDEYPPLTEEEGSAGIEVIETTMYDPAADADEPEAPIAEPPPKTAEPPARIAEPPARIAEPPPKTVDPPRKTVAPSAPPKRTASRRRRAEPEPVVDFDAVVAAAAARATGRAPEPPRAAPVREVVERRFTKQEPAEEPVERFELDAGRFRAGREAEEPQSRPLLRTARNAALVALLALVLLAQVVHHSRERLAEQPSVGPALMRLYRAFGASLEPRWNVAAYTVKQWGAAAESGPGALRLRASIVNTANRAQPYPLLRVTLLDRFGGKVARREFTPGEYLPGRTPEAPLLAANGKVDADLMLSDPGSEATGFELDACLRRVGTLSCATDSGPVR